MDLMERYQKDNSFREYVDRFCKAYNQAKEEVLNLALVREAARYYADIEPKVQTGKSTYAPLWECM